MLIEERWVKVVGDFRQICVLRREGRVEESNRLLREELPKSISAWSRCSDKQAAVKRTELERMFQQEQRRVDDAWMVQTLIMRRMSEHLLPSICSRVAEEVKQALTQELGSVPAVPAGSRSTQPESKVAFDDIPGVIDMLLSSESGRRRPIPAAAVPQARW